MRIETTLPNGIKVTTGVDVDDPFYMASHMRAIVDAVMKPVGGYQYNTKRFPSQPKKTFYRVEIPNWQDGLWYAKNGEFTGKIHTPEFSGLRLANLLMPYDQDIVGWVSVTDTLASLVDWFNDEDMAILRPKGFMVTEYESEDYREKDGHWVILQSTAKLIDAF